MKSLGRFVLTGLLAVASMRGGSSAAAQTGMVSLYGDVIDAHKELVPAATATVTNAEIGTSRTTVTDERGAYRFAGLPPGTYVLKVEMRGFKTAVVENLILPVGTTTRQQVLLEVGVLSESVLVKADYLPGNTDASLGNAISRAQIRALPIEAHNVLHLLSLQPTAVFVPRMPPQAGGDEEDPRYGAAQGARADQQNATLDGVDVNDAQLQTAYTSVVRIPQEALQEFRVSTTAFNADMGRSSGPQVSMITRSGSNRYDGAGYWTFRRTATSSNEYFLKLSQLGAGQPSEPPRLDKDIIGASVGGPVRANRLFFFGNFESLRERSETPVTRAVPSNSFRDGVLMYQCADAVACPGGHVRGFAGTHAVPAGWFGMTPGNIAALDPLGIGPSVAAAQYFQQYPSPNEPGRDVQNIAAFRFAAPIQNEFSTFIGRVDYNVSESGNHKVFGRFGGQDDTVNEAPQFPGQTPRRLRRFKNYGLAVGSDAVVSPRLVNSFRYGLSKIDEANLGATNSNYVTFRLIDSFDGVGAADTFSSTREPSTHHVVDDVSVLLGQHTLKLGTNVRFSRIALERFQNAFLSASVLPSWVSGVGRRHMPGSPFCTVPACAQFPSVSPTAESGYADGWLNILGVLSQSTQRANYDRDGQPLPAGTAVARTFGSDEFEFYVQDSWQIGPALTVTGGIRYSLNSPPYEVNGLQVAPTTSMGAWFDERVRHMQQGIPSSASPIISFDLAGPKNGRSGFYHWDKNNIAPRIAAAWTPSVQSPFLRWLTGDGSLVVRGGYSKVFDRVGLGLATNSDDGYAFGMSTSIDSPFGAQYEEDPAVRFTDVTTLPPTVPQAPAGGFPQTPPLRAGNLTQTIDDTLVTPSAHVVSAIVGRELSGKMSVEAGYVGRFGRDQLVRRDIAMPLNLVDTRSGMDYFSAARSAITAAQTYGATGRSPTADFAALPPIPYWENLFPAAAREGLTATQAVTQAFMSNGPDWMTALYEMDTKCRPACSIFGPYAYFSEQYDSLAAISSIGRSTYHGLVLSVRRRLSEGLQFDVNYTLSHSEDMGSQVERGSAYWNFINGGYSGFLVNSFDPESNYGTSDFDVRQQMNANWVLNLPFGQGRQFGSDVSRGLNYLIGDWAIAGLVRWTSGFPFNVFNCRACWTTNWNIQGNAMLVDPQVLPPTKTTRNAVNNRPSPFESSGEALAHFRRALPGEVGIHNLLRGDGYFTLDTSLSKAWSVGTGDQRIRFRWDVFNATNTPKFDVGQLQGFPDLAGFGRYTGTLATCDAQAGRCMQFALRYEF